MSPAFPSPEELANWLTEVNVVHYGNKKASYDTWLSIARGIKMDLICIMPDGLSRLV
ncbi:hypothetical protein R6242_16370 [Iodobacter sp. CM08]|uniref:hypothetical protein n=1 Tax=Iodobacter sp. CM08 TaxID=3085902 RepID=UPI00298244BC|nr:hypothetical protein [Iodobacter sp. CM08]MDW5418142.1 hypothetical protein [Iodobacter sp. CM08]